MDLKEKLARWEALLNAPARLLFLLIGLIGGWVIGMAFQEVLEPYWSTLKRGLGALADMPVGAVGLLVALFVMIAVGLYVVGTFIDTSPVASAMRDFIAQRTARKVAPLSYDEQRQIQTVRAFWNLHGKPGADALGSLGNEVRHELVKVNHLAPLLDPLLERFGKAAVAMDAAVADKSTTPLAEVHTALNEVVALYGRVVGLLIPIHEREVNLRDNSKDSILRWRFPEWVKAHSKMKDELTELREDPAHRGQIVTMADYREVDDMFPLQTLKTMGDALAAQEFEQKVEERARALLASQQSGTSDEEGL